ATVLGGLHEDCQVLDRLSRASVPRTIVIGDRDAIEKAAGQRPGQKGEHQTLSQQANTKCSHGGTFSRSSVSIIVSKSLAPCNPPYDGRLRSVRTAHRPTGQRSINTQIDGYVRKK